MVVILRQHCTILKYFRMLNLNLNINGAKKGLPYPLKDLTVHLTMQTYEDDGTTYYVNSRGPDIPVVGTDGGEDILDFSVLTDVRLDKSDATYWIQPLNNWFYYDSENPYHYKLSDFHYRYWQNAMASDNNYCFGKFTYDDESIDSVQSVLIYSIPQTGG